MLRCEKPAVNNLGRGESAEGISLSAKAHTHPPANIRKLSGFGSFVNEKVAVFSAKPLPGFPTQGAPAIVLEQYITGFRTCGKKWRLGCDNHRAHRRRSRWTS